MLFRLTVLLSLCLPVFSLRAEEKPWPAYGPWHACKIKGGGYVQNVVLCPSAPDRYYSYIDTGGIYRSDDRGENWRFSSLRMEPIPSDYETRGVWVSPSNADLLVAASTKGGLYRSENGGESWSQVLAAPFHGNDAHRHAGTLIASRPDRPDHILVASQGEGIFLSRDNGATWQPAPADRSPGRLYFTDLKFDRADPRRAWACATPAKPRNTSPFPDGGFFVTEDAGESWRKIGDASPLEILQDPVRPERLYGIWDNYWTIKVSDDRGATWTECTTGLRTNPPDRRDNRDWTSDARYNALAAGPDFIVCASAKGTFYRLVSGSMEWKRVERQAVHEPTDWTRGGGWLANYGSSFGEALCSVIIDPRDPDHWLSTDWYAIWETRDAGKNWSLHIDGIEPTVLHCLAQDPQSAATLHLGMSDTGYYRSSDGAVAFRAPITIPTGNAKYIAVPSGPGPIYMTGASPGGVWRSNQIFISDDRGDNWRRGSMKGLPDPSKHTFNCIEIHPGKPKELYVTASGPVAENAGGLYRSTDGGETWSWFGRGLVGNLFAEAIWTSGTHIAIQTDGSMLVAGDARDPWRKSDVFRLVGNRWERLRLDLGDGVVQVAADVRHPRRFYLTSSTRGLFRSDDGGASWKLLREQKKQGRLRLAIDRVVPDRLAIATPDTVLLSNDSGATWTDLDPEGVSKFFRPSVLAFVGDNLVFTTNSSGAYWTPVGRKN